jgi:pimeloyl-ACP methyl ester carboxylesterase
VPPQPQCEPRRRVIDIAAADGAGQVAALEFGDPSRPLDVLFLHANGFNAGTYRSALAPLADTMRVLAADMRGHGRTRLPTVAEGHSWMVFADDLLALLAALGEIPAVLSVANSRGGAAQTRVV